MSEPSPQSSVSPPPDAGSALAAAVAEVYAATAGAMAVAAQNAVTAQQEGTMALQAATTAAVSALLQPTGGQP